MAEPFSLAGTVLTAALQGAVEGAAGKLTEGPAGLLLGKVRGWLGGAKGGSIEAAVERAVEAAAQRTERASPSFLVRSLLGARAFLEEVQRMAVYGGRPDLAGLRQAYLAQAGSGAPVEIEHALESFFEAIQLNLELDPEIGSWLRDTRFLVGLAKLEATADVLAASSLRAEAQRHEQIEAARQSEGHLERMVRRAGAGPLGELTAEERLYLGRVVTESANLPLAVMGGGVAKAPGRQLRLEDVFVDLATTSAPSLERVFDLAGNVWERTADAREKDSPEKGLVGGAFYRHLEGVGPAARDWFRPNVRFINFGFRVVVVPSSRRRSDS